MPPAAKDILGDGVEVVTAMLVTVIVVVAAGETVRGVFARVALAASEIVGNKVAFSTSLIFRLRDVGLDHVLPLQLAHVVHHLVVKVRIVRSFISCRSGSVQ